MEVSLLAPRRGCFDRSRFIHERARGLLWQGTAPRAALQGAEGVCDVAGEARRAVASVCQRSLWRRWSSEGLAGVLQAGCLGHLWGRSTASVGRSARVFPAGAGLALPALSAGQRERLWTQQDQNAECAGETAHGAWPPTHKHANHTSGVIIRCMMHGRRRTRSSAMSRLPGSTVHDGALHTPPQVGGSHRPLPSNMNENTNAEQEVAKMPPGGGWTQSRGCNRQRRRAPPRVHQCDYHDDTPALCLSLDCATPLGAVSG